MIHQENDYITAFIRSSLCFGWGGDGEAVGQVVVSLARGLGFNMTKVTNIYTLFLPYMMNFKLYFHAGVVKLFCFMKLFILLFLAKQGHTTSFS